MQSFVNVSPFGKCEVCGGMESMLGLKIFDGRGSLWLIRKAMVEPDLWKLYVY